MHGAMRSPNSYVYFMEAHFDQQSTKQRPLSRSCPYYAGPAFSKSPPASALPFPKKFWKDNSMVYSKQHADDVEICAKQWSRITNDNFLECLEGFQEDVDRAVEIARTEVESLRLLVKKSAPMEEQVSDLQNYRGTDTCPAQTQRLLAQNNIYFQHSSVYASLLKKYWPKHFEKYATWDEACGLIIPDCGGDESHDGCSETISKCPIPLPINNAQSKCQQDS